LTEERVVVAAPRKELAKFRRNGLWFVPQGLTLIVVGVSALWSFVSESHVTARPIGALLLAGGMAEAFGAIRCWGRKGVFLHLLASVLSIVIGVLFLWPGVETLNVLSELLTGLLLAAGAFKIFAGLRHRVEAWGWPPESGIIDVLLGVLIWHDGPDSALWVFGLFVGVSLVFRGFHWIGLGLTLRGQQAVCQTP